MTQSQMIARSARLIEEIESLGYALQDISEAIEELRETGTDSKRLQAAESWADQSRAMLDNAERGVREMWLFLK
jgi:hypothetical protein